MICTCGSRWIQERFVCYATGEPIVWQCLMCGSLLEPDGNDRWKVTGALPVILPHGLAGLGFIGGSL